MHVFKHPNSEFPRLNEFSFERRQRVDKEKAKSSSQAQADNEAISKKSFSWSSDDDDDDDFNVADKISKTVKEKAQVDRNTRHSKFKKY
jgi:hypothetical protein